MKASNVKSQKRKKTIWNSLSRHFGKSFWIMMLWCVSCTPNMSIPAMLPVTGGEAEANTIVFSPDRVDFGIQTIDSTSAAQKVTLQNDGTDSLVIASLSVTAGFSIVANTCPTQPKELASQGTCAVEIVFKPNLPQDWVGELQLTYGSGQSTTMPLKGTAQPVSNLMASMFAGGSQGRPVPPAVVPGH